MKDIDFDELDRAVNSLMSTVPAGDAPATPAANAPIAQPAPTNPAGTAVEVSSQTQSSATTESSQPQIQATPQAAAPQQAVPATRRAGRFMDMVHSSSDMKARDATPAPSRVGVTIAPRQDASTEAPATESSPALTSEEPQSEAKPVEAPTSMPDPLDIASSASAQELGEQSAAAPEPAIIPDPIDIGTLPGESPFLADAKVEKRPLNAGTPEPAQPPFPAIDLESELSDEPKADNSDTIDDGTSQDEPPAVPEVPELSSDLVAIESNEVNATQATETVDAVAQTATPQAPLGAASIPQQYAAQESSGDQSHAAIYDASQYPEPMSHPAKSKSGWMWIVWVLLLLGAGAGGAVLLYNFGIIG